MKTGLRKVPLVFVFLLFISMQEIFSESQILLPESLSRQGEIEVLDDYYGEKAVLFKDAKSFVETTFELPEKRNVDVWIYIYLRWDEDVFAVNVDGKETIIPQDTPETKGRWDLENAEVWHWRKVEFGNLSEGKHVLKISSPAGYGTGLNRIVIATGKEPAWAESWLTGELSGYMKQTPVFSIDGKTGIFEVEKFSRLKACDIKNVGSAGEAVVMGQKDSALGTVFSLSKEANYSVWARVFFENKNWVEAPILEEFCQCLYFELDGEMKRTIYEADEKRWHWEYLGNYDMQEGNHLIQFRKRGSPVYVDKVVFYPSQNEPFNEEWFKKTYPHVLPFGLNNDVSFDNAVFAGDWRVFGELANETKINVHLPVELNLPINAGMIVLEKNHPLKSNESLALRNPEQQLELSLWTDKPGVKIEAVLKDRTGESFRVAFSGVNESDRWEVVFLNIPRGKNFPLELTHVVIDKPEGSRIIRISEPAFVSPFSVRCEKPNESSSDKSFRIEVRNNSKQDRIADVYYQMTKVLPNWVSSNVPTLENLLRIDLQITEKKGLIIPAGKSATVAVPLEISEQGIYALDYSVGTGKTKKYYFANGASYKEELAQFIATSEKRNGAYRLNSPINGVKRDDVAEKYGKVEGLTIIADGIDACGREYADRVGYRNKLRPVGYDLSEANGWPFIHVPVGEVAIDPVLGRVKFAEGNNNPPVKAGYLVTGFGVPSSAPPQIHNGYLWLTVGEADIFVCDISNPAELKSIGFVENWHFLFYLHFYKNYAYFRPSHRGTCLIDNVYPYKPGKIRYVNLRMDKYGAIQTIFEDSDVAYTSSHILDLTDPYNPKPIGQINANRIVVTADKKRGYVADGNKCAVYNTSNPKNPEKISEFEATGNIVDIDNDNLLFRDKNKFLVYKGLDKPVKQTEFEFFATQPSYIGGANIYKGHVYVIDARKEFTQNNSYDSSWPHSRIYVYDLSGKQVGVYEDPKPTQYSFFTVDRKTGFAYTNDYNAGLWSFDLSDPANPKKAGGILVSSEVRFGFITQQGVSAMSQYFGGGVIFADVTDPTNPKRTGEFWDGSFNDWQARYAGKDKTFYMSRQGGGMIIVDVSNASKPKQVGALPGGEPYVVDDRLYHFSNRTLRIYDISIPNSPKELGSLNDAGWTVIAVRDNKAYCYEKSRIIVIDVSVPSALKKIGELNDSHLDAVFHSVQHAGVSRHGYMYVANYADMKIPVSVFDVRNPESMRYVKTVTLVKEEETVASSWGDCCLGYCELVGDYFFVPRYGSQVDVYDISDPENPKFSGGALCGMMWHAGNQVGDYLYVPTLEGLWIADVPASPQIPEGEVSNK